MKRNIIKIILDVLMTAILVLLYNSYAINMAFHEIAGLCIFILFIIHCLLNIKWIRKITVRFFIKSLPPRIRLYYILDFLLLISFSLIIISGIYLSKILFPMINPHEGPWKTIHLFFSGFSIILIGIHIGLHWTFISNIFKKIVKISFKFAKPLGIVLLLIILAFGFYSIVTSNFTNWLASPFIEQAQKDEHTNKAETTKNDITNTSKETKGSTTEILYTIATFSSIIGVFTTATHYIGKYLSKHKKVS